jgi:oligopeptide/dipeptide ABC transporter ATP-binding protein
MTSLPTEHTRIGAETFLSVQNVVKYFPVSKEWFAKKREFVHAVDDVSFSIAEGESFGLAGESGCGKTTLARVVLGLVRPTAGAILFEGNNILELRKEELRRLRRNMQMVPQDPIGSLDPRQIVLDIVAEPIRTHLRMKRNDLEKRVLELLELVGLSSEHLRRYPHEFSGGQRQRIGIARALALRPRFVVLDEPTSSLDVSVQAQILNLLKELQSTFGLTYLFISHNMSVIRHMCAELAIMYLGKVVESGTDEDIFENAAHPYTIALLASIPKPSPTTKRQRQTILGEAPSPLRPPSGCRFRTRCPRAIVTCSNKEPQLVKIGAKHFVACHLVE